MVITTLGTSVCALAWLIEKVYHRPANKSRTTALQVEWTRNQWEVANKRTAEAARSLASIMHNTNIRNT